MNALDDLAHLYERATAGPWEDAGTSGAVVSNNEDAVDAFREWLTSPVANSSINFYNGVPVLESCQRADRDLILAMHAALPELLACRAALDEIEGGTDAGLKSDEWTRWLARIYRSVGLTDRADDLLSIPETTP